MSHVDAVYRHGVFQPLGPVDFAEEQRVKLSIEPMGKETLEVWLGKMKLIHKEMMERVGVLPDSTPDIAADRMR